MATWKPLLTIAVIVLTAVWCCPSSVNAQGRCSPNPCQNGATCRARSRDHVCLNCDRRRFRGRDCEPVENDAGPWGQWSNCSPSSGFRRRRRECIKPVFFSSQGRFECNARLSETDFCGTPRPQPSAPRPNPGDAGPGAERAPSDTVPPTPGPGDSDTPVRRPVGGNRCSPNPCKNGASCRARSRDHVCDGCDRARFGRGRDCEPVENDAGPWGQWGACSPRNGFRRRSRECVKPVFFSSQGRFECNAQLSETDFCGPPEVRPPPPADGPQRVAGNEIPTPERPTRRPVVAGGRCSPNPCRNGARCRARSRDHVCDGCNRARYGRGRDCESVENDAGPWGQWGACSPRNGFRRRSRECVKPVFLGQQGRFVCNAQLSETDYCGLPQAPPAGPQRAAGNDASPTEEPTQPPTRRSVARGGRCSPNPCKNGARCRSRSRDHVCEGCNRAVFGRGRDCEPVENDAGPWGQWGACSPSNGFRRRRRDCVKPVFLGQQGRFVCNARLSETSYCGPPQRPAGPQRVGGNDAPTTEEPQQPTRPAERRPVTGGGRCSPNPCKNGASCRARSRDHVCVGCNRAVFGRGRDCEPVENDAGPWGQWGDCSPRNGFRRRRRDCVKPVFLGQQGRFVCNAPVSETQFCAVGLTTSPRASNQAPDPCSSHQCRNGGQCEAYQYSDNYRCVCPAGFGGDRCQARENTALAGPWGAWSSRCVFGCPGRRYRRRQCRSFSQSFGTRRCLTSTTQLELCDRECS